jgi:alkylation response protein AidB-like acyl-CoA dehydrogenase
VALAKETTRDGKPAIEDPEIRQRLVELEGYVKAHKYSGYRQFTKDAKGENAGIITMMQKIMSTNIGHDAARLSLDLLGDDGLLGAGARNMGLGARDHTSWIAHYMYSLGIAVAGGTANIQRNVIGERGLGLPRDAAADRSKGL